MGDFYQTLETAHQWLVSQGVDATAASTAVGSYYATFNHASKDSTAGFQHLVDEQTPGACVRACVVGHVCVFVFGRVLVCVHLGHLYYWPKRAV